MTGICTALCQVKQIKEYFNSYLENLTELEKSILYDYFARGQYMIHIAKKYRIGRIKIKNILLSCIKYLKEKFDEDFSIKSEEEKSKELEKIRLKSI